jgi:hypothetical protein
MQYGIKNAAELAKSAIESRCIQWQFLTLLPWRSFREIPGLVPAVLKCTYDMKRTFCMLN